MTVLGIDYGRRRIGVAVSDSGDRIASPLTVIDRRKVPDSPAAVRDIAREYEADRIVVGLPLHTDGGPSEMSEEACGYAEKLRAATGLPVEMWDERFSSARAESAMLGADLSRRRRSSKIDKVAAQVILQSYLDSQRR